jgi:ribosomal protein S18 acetylase RimI-like enzyme
LNSIAISRVQSVAEIENILVEFNRVFIPPLEERILNFKSYAEKLVEKGYAYIAMIDSKTVGFIVFYANDSATNIGYLTQIAVKQECKIKGVGYALIKQFESISYEKGMKTLKLEVSNCNKHAIKFYIRNGYEYYGKATESTIFMAKNIIDTEVR